MKQRRLGHSDLFVSELGLGCMSLGQDKATAINIIHAALSEGINFLDTADLYHQGLNEEFVGAAIQGHRHDVILATKVGNRFERGQAGWTWDPSKKYIMQEVKESLRRLGTDYIDLYQLHGGTIEDNMDETIEAFEQLQAEGVIRWYGISSIRPNVIREYVSKSRMVSVMMQYSLLDRRPEESMLNLLAEHSISVIARGPVARGRLVAGGLDRMQDKEYLGLSLEELQGTVAQVQEFAQSSKRTMNEVALRYDLASPTVASVIAGASSVHQLRQNAAAVQSIPLRPEEVRTLRDITPALTYTRHR